MKTREEVERRLRKLRARYRLRHVAAATVREHRNCVYNYLHKPTPVPTPAPVPTRGMVPSRQVTLIVFQDRPTDRLVGVCTYGSDNPATWTGELCDDDVRPARCPMFVPRVAGETAAAEFDAVMADDARVLEDYPDVASLQWVLQERPASPPLRLYDRLAFLVFRIVAFFASIGRRLPAPGTPEIVWNDPSENLGPRSPQAARQRRDPANSGDPGTS